jgi:hypothetical protein
MCMKYRLAVLIPVILLALLLPVSLGAFLLFVPAIPLAGVVTVVMALILMFALGVQAGSKRIRIGRHREVRHFQSLVERSSSL